MSQIKCTLTADVIHTRQKTGKVKVNTVAIIKFGTLTLGGVKLTGRYDGSQVLAELRRNGIGKVNLTPVGKDVLPTVLNQ